MPKPTRHALPFEYDICLSFAGEDRKYVKTIASTLVASGVRVFYDEYEQANLWGKDLYTHLDDIYQNSARYCVLFISKHYAKKLWTNHERQSAQARAFREHKEYILPVSCDDTEMPGVRSTIGHINLRTTSQKQLVNLIIKKLGKETKSNYLPPVPNRLFEKIEAHVKDKRQISREIIMKCALHFFMALKRMTSEERDVVFQISLNGCPHDLPNNIHISLDLLSRVTGFNPRKILRLLGGLQSLGFVAHTRKGYISRRHLGTPDTIIVLEWHDMSADKELDQYKRNATGVAEKMISGATEDFCHGCAGEALRRLDFSQLATVTSIRDTHSKLSRQRKTKFRKNTSSCIG